MKINIANSSDNDLLLSAVMNAYALPIEHYEFKSIEVGLINQTFLIKDKRANHPHYILQNINTDVFTQPEDIDHNILLITKYLQKHSSLKNYLKLIPTSNGDTLLQVKNQYYRLYNYFENTITYNTVESADLAWEAASAFANFSYALEGLDLNKLKITIPNFHHLHYRALQLEKAYQQANENRIRLAKDVLQKITAQKRVIEFSINIPYEYEFVKRVMHHDTKISNILFDINGKSVCVIDLDTCMPGYLFSDWGDMIRTYVCPIHESSKEYDNIYIRKEYLEAIYDGYLTGMPSVTALEKEHFTTFGEMMILMQSIRFITDFLNNDIYYPVDYPEENLVRATNQITLLNALQKSI